MTLPIHRGGWFPPVRKKPKSGSESHAQKIIKSSLEKLGIVLYRNNCGANKDRYGHYIKYGVANPGGSDLIGWTTVTITKEMIGEKIAVFTAVEIKKPGVKIKATKFQERFLEKVKKAGGYSGMARDIKEALEILNKT